MSAVAGWYTDPSGAAGQLRWWDGERWTEHVTADPSTPSEAAAATDEVDGTSDELAPASDEVAGVSDDAAAAEVSTSATTPPPPAAGDLLAPATTGAPAWGSGAATTGGQPPPPPGAPGSAPAWGSAGSAWGGAPAAPSWQPVPRASGNGVRTGLIIAAVAAVVLVALVGTVFVGVVRSAGEFSVSVGSDEGFGRLDGEITVGGPLRPGDHVRADVPDGGSLELELPVEAAGTVTIDVRGAGGFDAVAELVDEFDEVIAYNDDRSGNGGLGGGHLDPLLDVDLQPGTYRVYVRGFGGDSGTVDVSRS